jgi:hypothetical protein
VNMAIHRTYNLLAWIVIKLLKFSIKLTIKLFNLKSRITKSNNDYIVIETKDFIEQLQKDIFI